MHSRQAFVLEALHGVQGFFDSHPGLPQDVNPANLRRKLDDVADRLANGAVDQQAESRSGLAQTATVHRLRENLRLLHMKPIAVVAKARLREFPEFIEFSLPTASTPSTQLIALAGAMAAAAEKHLPTFVASGLQDDCVVLLRAAAEELTEAVASRSNTVGRACGATAELASMEREARLFLAVLDALMLPRLRMDDGLSREWKMARRIRRKPGVPVGTTREESSAAEPRVLSVAA